jgi:IclR family KDG regulon transcriptional repressor
MERKYWVPALERALAILHCIAEQPSKLRLIDLAKATGVHKSSMFSLLHTMEMLGLVKREKGDTYSLGLTVAVLGNAYFSNFSLVEAFMDHAGELVRSFGETVQLARLEQGDVVYLAKKESGAHVRLMSEPGMRLPAYATALGKMLLSGLADDSIRSLFTDEKLKPMTEHTIRSVEALLTELRHTRERGFATEEEEIVLGFCCVAAPIYDQTGQMVAACSFTILKSNWSEKQNQAMAEIQRLARTLSNKMQALTN